MQWVYRDFSLGSGYHVEWCKTVKLYVLFKGINTYIYRLEYLSLERLQKQIPTIMPIRITLIDSYLHIIQQCQSPNTP